MNLLLGLWIRNTYGLWRGNRELLADCARLGDPGDGSPEGAHPRIDPDHASSLILGAAWDRLQESRPAEP